MASRRPRRIGPSRPLASAAVHRSAVGRSSCAASPSARARWLGRALWSPKTLSPERWSPVARHDSSAIGKLQEWKMLQTNTVLKPVPQLRKPISVPLADLRAQYNSLRSEMISTLLEVAGSTSYVLGPHVESFERNFASFVGAKHCVGVNSGTSALHLAMICAGVGPGDEVITVPMTFVATAWGISYVGATPVFVDIDPVTYTMDVEQVEKKITLQTRAILPVHLYGQPADMSPLLEIGKRYCIPVIE